MRAQKSYRSAFTIVELLIAATITVGIVVLLGSMFGSLSTTASKSNQRIDAFRDARAALQMMARDLACVVHVPASPYFVINTDLAGNDVRQVDGLISIKNQPPGSSTSVTGDMCAVRYYCGWNNNAYSLRRYFRDSTQTLQTLQPHLNAGPPSSIDYKDTNARIGELYNGSSPIDEPLASYVWNLQVVAYDGSGNIINQQNDAFGHPTTGAPYVCDPAGSTKALPAAIEISFDAISSDAARTVQSATSQRPDGYKVWQVVGNPSASSTDTQLFQRLIAPNIYHFRTRVSFQ